jgi:hypothetical protein
VARRFISEDPIGYGGSPNLYAYVDGKVLDGRDPTGLIVDYSLLAPPAPDEVFARPWIDYGPDGIYSPKSHSFHPDPRLQGLEDDYFADEHSRYMAEYEKKLQGVRLFVKGHHYTFGSHTFKALEDVYGNVTRGDDSWSFGFTGRLKHTLSGVVIMTGAVSWNSQSGVKWQFAGVGPPPLFGFVTITGGSASPRHGTCFAIIICIPHGG